MMKTIDLSKNVHDLCNEHPGLLPLMAELGFSDITKPGMLQTAGRFMTIPLGAKMKGIQMERIVALLQDAGFSVIEVA